MAVGDTPLNIAGPQKTPENLVQHEYLDKFIIDLEEDREAGEAPT